MSSSTITPWLGGLGKTKTTTPQRPNTLPGTLQHPAETGINRRTRLNNSGIAAKWPGKGPPIGQDARAMVGEGGLEPPRVLKPTGS